MLVISSFDDGRAPKDVPKQGDGTGFVPSPTSGTYIGTAPSTDSFAFMFDHGSICSSAAEHFLKVLRSIRGSGFALKPIDMELTGRLIAGHISSVSWEFNLMLHPNIDMVRLLLRKLKTTAHGMDGILLRGLMVVIE